MSRQTRGMRMTDGSTSYRCVRVRRNRGSEQTMVTRRRLMAGVVPVVAIYRRYDLKTFRAIDLVV